MLAIFFPVSPSCGWPPACVSAGLQGSAVCVAGSCRTASVPACAGAAEAAWVCRGLWGQQPGGAGLHANAVFCSISWLFQ